MRFGELVELEPGCVKDVADLRSISGGDVDDAVRIVLRAGLDLRLHPGFGQGVGDRSDVGAGDVNGLVGGRFGELLDVALGEQAPASDHHEVVGRE